MGNTRLLREIHSALLPLKNIFCPA